MYKEEKKQEKAKKKAYKFKESLGKILKIKMDISMPPSKEFHFFI